MKKPALALFTAIFFLAMPPPGLAGEITVISEDFPPLNYLDDGRLKGPSADIVRRIVHSVGAKDSQIDVYPWARGYLSVQKKPNTALFSTVRNPEREHLFKWVGPLAVKRAVFFAEKNSDIVISDLHDAKRVKAIGVQIQYAYERDLMNAGFKNIDSVPEDRLNLSKLVNGRISLWYTGYYSGFGIAEKEGLRHMIKPVFTVKKIELYIAFNRQTDDTVVTRWQDALEHLNETGTTRKIFTRYNMEPLMPGGS